MAGQVPQRFVETGHPIFTGTNALSRGVLERKKNKKTIHFTVESSNVELLLRIIHSANKLSVYGAVSSWSGQSSPGGLSLILERLGESEETFDEETAKSVNMEEVNSLVDFARSWYAS